MTLRALLERSLQHAGFHAMAVAVLTGRGDPEVLRLLPATIDPRTLNGLRAIDEVTAASAHPREQQ